MIDIDLFFIKVFDINDNVHEVQCFGYKNTIAYIKAILGEQLDIDRNNIILHMNNNELSDFYDLEYYSINKNSKIRMFLCLKSGI